MNKIYTCIDGVYGEATPKGQPPIAYDPETEEGFAAIARVWGDDEAQATLKAARSKDIRKKTYE